MRLILLGPPGSGKGTQADYIQSKYSINKLSTGDILRSNEFQKSFLYSKVKDFMEAGKLVPDDIIIEVISHYLKQEKYSKGFILDGFPRTLEQAKVLDRMLEDISMNLDMVIQIKVDYEELIDRICNRFSCSSCKENYNKKHKPTTKEGICNICGSEEFTFRSDDKADKISTRLDDYHNQTLQLLPYYTKKEKLYTVNGMLGIEEVKKEIENTLKVLT